MHGEPLLLPSSPQREGVREVQVCGSLHLAVLLIGALGAKIWLPAPCGHGKGFVPMGIPHLTLAMEPVGRGLSSGVLHSISAVMGSRCFSPHSPHQGSHVLGSGLAVVCPNTSGRSRICPVSPSSSCQGLWGMAVPSVPLPCATEHRVGDWDIIPAEFLPTNVCHHHPTLPTKRLLCFWLPLKTTPGAALGGSFSALSAPNALSPKVGTHRDVPLSSSHDIYVSEAEKADAIPSPIPLLLGGCFHPLLFAPQHLGGGKDGGGAGRFCVSTTYLFF